MYKIIKNNQVIDLLETLTYVQMFPTNYNVVRCGLKEAQGIMSSDKKTIWHLQGFYDFPIDKYETVEAVKISKEEYHQLKALNGKTVEEIIDEYTLSLIEGGLL